VRLLTAALLLLLACAASAAAQEKGKGEEPPRPDLTGTWVQDLQKSRYPWPRDLKTATTITLVIEHREPELKVRQLINARDYVPETALHYTDGRGEKKPMAAPARGVVRTKTRWKKSRLVVSGRVEPESSQIGERHVLEYTETWEVSADGKVLTKVRSYTNLLQSSSSPSRPDLGGGVVKHTGMDTTLVFNRAP
jgi:hypothetical protein